MLVAAVAAALWQLWSIPSWRPGVETPEAMARLAAAPNTLPDWPPSVGRGFPEISLTDHAGEPFSMIKLRGRPVLVELGAMTCVGCEALSGAAKYGGFGGMRVSPEYGSLEEYARTYGGVNLFGGEVAFVQIIAYNLSLNPPTPSQLADWRRHFHLNEHPEAYVVGGGAALASGVTYRMIPGVLLLDREGIVRVDSTGDTPKQDLFRELLPELGRMVRGE